MMLSKKEIEDIKKGKHKKYIWRMKPIIWKVKCIVIRKIKEYWL